MIDPNGVYGVIPKTAAWEGSTSAIGLQRQQANYNKLREIEHTYNKRRTSRYRDTAMVIGIVAVTMILVAILVIWLVQRFNNKPDQPENLEITLPNFVGRDYEEAMPELEELRQQDLEIEIHTVEDDSVNQELSSSKIRNQMGQSRSIPKVPFSISMSQSVRAALKCLM